MTTAAANLARDPDDNMARVEDFELFMRPIIRILLLFRVSLPAFIALVKKLYLEEAKQALEHRKEDVSVPKLAFEAGCTDIGLVSDFIKGRRTTVADIGDLPRYGAARDAVPVLSLEGIILDRWQSDPLYRDEQGRPVTLPVRGPAGRSFDGLVRRCVSGRMSYGPILETLKQAGAIDHNTDTDEVTLMISDPDFGRGKGGKNYGAGTKTTMYLCPNEKLHARIRIGSKVKPLGSTERRNLRAVFESAVRGISHLASTCADNLRLVFEDREHRAVLARLQMEYFSTRIPAAKYWEFKALSREMIMGAVNQWASRAQAEIEAPPGPNQLAGGIGVYFWDARPDVHDTEHIGMPEILPPEQEP